MTGGPTQTRRNPAKPLTRILDSDTLLAERETLQRQLRDDAVAAPAPTFLAVYSHADHLRFRYCIYGLVNPRRPEGVEYVGQTTGHVLTRYDSHLRDAERLTLKGFPLFPVHEWIIGLRAKGILPSIVVLEVVKEDKAELDAAEQEWIRFYQYRGMARHNRQMRLREFYGVQP